MIHKVLLLNLLIINNVKFKEYSRFYKLETIIFTIKTGKKIPRNRHRCASILAVWRVDVFGDKINAIVQLRAIFDDIGIMETISQAR